MMKPVIIGIDHGYGNIKTAHTCFQTGVIIYDKEPAFKSNLLVYEGRFYIIGDGHKGFTAKKMLDQDYYILTLAAVAEELSTERVTEADVFIAAGLPLTWTSGGKEAFVAYLTKNPEVEFTYKGRHYHIRIVGAAVYPQGYAAVAPAISKMNGIHLICDIGNGTMNLLYIVNGQP